MEELITKLFRRKTKSEPPKEQIQDDLELPQSWSLRHKEVPEGFKVRRGQNLLPSILERLNRRIGRGTKIEKQYKSTQGEARPADKDVTK